MGYETHVLGLGIPHRIGAAGLFAGITLELHVYIHVMHTAAEPEFGIWEANDNEKRECERHHELLARWRVLVQRIGATGVQLGSHRGA